MVLSTGGEYAGMRLHPTEGARKGRPYIFAVQTHSLL